MVNLNLIAVKLAELRDRVSRVRAHCPATPDELRERDKLDLISFNLMLAVQTCADIASHLIADEGWPAANTLGESFARLREQGVLSKEIADALSRAVGLRNVVAHGYAGIDVGRVHAAATSGMSDLDDFAHQVAKWVGPPRTV
jgi:uncharacterized protein YutE (UPF0331/DUF86 family)